MVSSAETNKGSVLEPIAICGMAARLPGRVSSPSQLWDMLMAKRHGLIDWPRGTAAMGSRFNADGFCSTAPRKGTIQAPQAYLLDHVSMDALDAYFFPFSAQEMARMDPMHRQLLEVAYECAENAGAVNMLTVDDGQATGAARDVGVFVGVFGEDFLQESVMDSQVAGLYRGTGFMDFLQANRISFALNWQGPSMVVKTGCSASLVALDMACHSLRSGECSAAVVLGVNLITCPLMTILYTAQGLLSPTGRCNTFDAAADGYGRGEACNAVYLRRLSDALHDGDPVRAIVVASATGHDGRKPAQLRPNAEAQEMLIRKTYRMAGITRYDETAWFECHGTGTAAGDPLELRAVGNVFGENGIIVGAVKPNVGHSEGAAGLTSLIKAVLSLEHRIIPPNIFFKSPNPLIPWKKARLTVPVDPIPWPSDRRERVSVNSFGVGGSNAHVIVESFRAQDDRDQHESMHGGPKILLLSTVHPESLPHQARNHREYVLRKFSQDLACKGDDNAARRRFLHDMAYTLACRRRHFANRTYVVVQDPCDIRDSPHVDHIPSFSEAGRAGHVKDGARSWIAFVFTGQGAQTARMGYELLRDNELFAQTIQDLDRSLQALPPDLRPAWTIFDELAKPATQSRIHETSFSLPCSTAVQLGLVNVLRGWGVSPAAVVGHSSGEVASAYAAGFLTARTAITIAYLRGFVLHQYDPIGPTRPGAMAAIGLGDEEVRPHLGPGVVVACENSNSSTTVSGDRDAVEALLERVGKAHPDVTCRLLNVQTAFHSHHVAGSAERYEQLLAPFLSASATQRSSSCRLFSSVTGSLLDEAEILSSPRYWKESLARPVLFRQALGQLLDTEATQDNLDGLVMLEIGPHPALAKPTQQIIQYHLSTKASTTRIDHIPTLRRCLPADVAILCTAGDLWSHGAIDASQLADFVGPGGRCLTDLPPYAWHHGNTRPTDYPRIARVYKGARFLRHELLGTRVPDSTDVEPSWRCVLELADQPAWLGHHVVDGQVVFPAAGYVAMAGEAVRQIALSRGGGSATTGDYVVRDVHVKAPLVVPPGATVELFTRLGMSSAVSSSKDGNNDGRDLTWYDFHLMALVPERDGDAWTSHCRGLVASGTPSSSRPIAQNHLDAIRQKSSNFARRVRTAEWYSIADAVGLSYGMSLQTLEDIAASTKCPAAVASAYDDFDDDVEQPNYAAHPVLIDACLQLALTAMCQGLRRRCQTLLVPTHIKELEVVANNQGKYMTAAEEGGNEGDEHEHDQSCSKLELAAEIRWVRRGRELRASMAAANSSSQRPRVAIREATFLAKPRAASKVGAAAVWRREHDNKLASTFEWAPDVEFADLTQLAELSAGEVLHKQVFKNPYLKILFVGGGRDVDVEGTLLRATAAALRSQRLADGRFGTSLTYAALTAKKLKEACNVLDKEGLVSAQLLQLSKRNFSGEQLAGASFDLVLFDTAETYLDAVDDMMLPPNLCLAPAGWLMVVHSTVVIDRRLAAQDEEFAILRGCSLPGATTIARSRVSSLNKKAQHQVTHVVVLTHSLLCENMFTQALTTLFIRAGFSTELCVWDPARRSAPNFNDYAGLESEVDLDHTAVVSAVDLEGQPNTVANLSAHKFCPFIDSLTSARCPVVWLLPPLQDGSTGPSSLCPDPDAACMLGLARTARNEYPSLDLTTVEVDTTNDEGRNTALWCASVVRLVRQLHLGRGADREFGIAKDGTVLVPRMTWQSLPADDADAGEKGMIMQLPSPPGDTNTSANTTENTNMPTLFRSNASYLLVGGLGGIGMAISRWMVEHGARSLIFLSRQSVDQDPTGTKRDFLAELASMDCSALVVTGNVEEPADVARAVSAANMAASPQGGGLAGVLHLAMVLRDRSLATMTWDDWRAAVTPKLRGAWNLHQAVTEKRAKIRLDFMVFFGSVSGIIGHRGQANYNAANCALEALAIHRRGLGLPATVLHLGIVGDVGAVARDSRLAARFRRADYAFLSETDVLAAVAAAVRPDAPVQVIVGLQQAEKRANTYKYGGTMDDYEADNAVAWECDPRIAKALGVTGHRSTTTSATSTSPNGTTISSSSHATARNFDDVHLILRDARENPSLLRIPDRQRALATMLGAALAEALARPASENASSLTVPTESLGLDSFSAQTMAASIREKFGVTVTAEEMRAAGRQTLLGLAGVVIERLMEREGVTNFKQD